MDALALGPLAGDSAGAQEAIGTALALDPEDPAATRAQEILGQTPTS